MKRKTLILLFICGIVGMLKAQTYSTQRLSQLGEMLPAKSIPAKDSVFLCSKVLQGKRLVVNYNDKKEVEHLGVSLFSSESKQLINKPICDFIERILLDLLLHEKQGKLQWKLDEFNITITKTGVNQGAVRNLAALLNGMKEPVQFSIQQESTNDTVLWKFDEYNGFEITFPANRELIFGTNKKESDYRLSELLSGNQSQTDIANAAFSIDYELKSMEKNPLIFEQEGAEFIIPQLNNTRYYFKDTAQQYVPVFDDRTPEISLKNLLLMPQLTSTLQLHVKHRQYGGFTPEFTITVNDFIRFFASEFETYCHVEITSENLLKATLILHNRQYSYIHLLIINTALENFLRENNVLNAEFYTNIPQDNIKNLFK